MNIKQEFDSKSLLISAAFCVFIYLFDIIIDVFYFQNGSLYEHFFHPEEFEIYIRSLLILVVLIYGLITSRSIAKLKATSLDRSNKIAALENAMHEIKTLKGLLPICASCKKIKDDNGNWSQFEVYIRDRSDADFSHDICPECSKNLYGVSLEKDS